MPLGIRPTVDFAFKKIFGNPNNPEPLIGLLNAILLLAAPIEDVEILNPFSLQEFATAKQVVLDVRGRDSRGRWLNIEMQVATYRGLLERLVYYACSMYVEQLEAGASYAQANPAISICLLNHQLFPATPQAHHQFQLTDAESGRTLDNAIQVHTLELLKYNLDKRTIDGVSKLEQWVFLLTQAQDYDAQQLHELLPSFEFQPAIRVIETICAKTEDRAMYDQREKSQRDYEWVISGAREEGSEQGILAGKIQALQEVLGETVTDKSELLKLPQLEQESLHARLRTRCGLNNN